jgi:hypothetical protein
VETPNNTERVIVVLGMHRSGTSVIARGLKVLGVELGDNLLPAQPDNVTGFWEDKKVVAINTALLNSCGQDWHTFGALDVSQQYEIMQQARDYIKEVLKDVPVWGFKDPRTARVLPFWNSVFNSLAINPSYCVVIRHPLSVAKSLKKRNRFKFLRSSLLWYQYSMDMLDGLGDGVFTLVDYDEYLENPRSELERIAKGMKLEKTLNEQQFREYLDNYLSPTFRHSRYDLNNFTETDGIPEEVAELYRCLHALTIQERTCISADLRLRVAQWKACQKMDRSLFCLINEYGDCEMLLHVCEDRLNIALKHVEQTLKERDSVLAEAEIYKQRHHMAVASLEHTQGEVEDIRKLLGENARQLNELLNSRSWKITAPLRTVVGLIKATSGIITKGR